MASTAYEITGSLGNVVSDDEILFPNLLSNVAVTCRVGGGLVGANLSLNDRAKLAEFVTYVVCRYGRPSDVFVAGPVLGAHNLNAFASFLCPILVLDTSGGSDVRAKTSNGSLSFALRPNAGAGFSNVSLDRFIG